MNSHTIGIFEELGFRYNPADLYLQTIQAVLGAAEHLDLPRHLQLILAQPKNEIMVHFPVRCVDGQFRLFKGYRVQHNNILGPFKGGIRYHHSVSLDDIKSLAVLMTMKCSLMRLPLGGAKGGVQVNPRSLSELELMNLTRRFTSALGQNIGPEHDIPAPDVGTNAQVMAWMADTYMNFNAVSGKHLAQAVVTGKPFEFGGSRGREQATGLGLVYVLEQLLPQINMPLETLTFSLIGYGNVGSWAGRLLAQRGAKLTAVMDHTGALINTKGIDAEALAAHVQRTGGVHGFGGAEAMTEDEFYRHRVDLFIPAALEQMVTEERAAVMNCRVLAEAANAPTTPPAERLLLDRGVTVLPAILCNAGGVTVSYFEWKQNRQAETWDEQHVFDQLRKEMHAAAERVMMSKEKYGCDLRTAAYCTALVHLGHVYKVRGIFP